MKRFTSALSAALCAVLLLSACGSTVSTPAEETAAETAAAAVQTMAGDVELSVEQDGAAFVVTTNLPDGTVLSFTLEGTDYTGQDKQTVEDGRCTSAAFSDNGAALTGDYTLTVSTPLPSTQPEEVQAVIGTAGENLTGDLVAPSEFDSTQNVVTYTTTASW